MMALNFTSFIFVCGKQSSSVRNLNSFNKTQHNPILDLNAQLNSNISNLVEYKSTKNMMHSKDQQ